MKALIAKEGDEVSEHFGRCSQFTILDIQNNELLKKEEIENPGHSPGYLPKFFKNNGIDLVIAGGMGRKAINLFNEFDIELFLGVSGKVEDIIEKFLSNKLTGGDSKCKAH